MHPGCVTSNESIRAPANNRLSITSRSLLRLPLTEQRADNGKQLLRAERLGEIGIHAASQALLLIGLVGMGGQVV